MRLSKSVSANFVEKLRTAEEKRGIPREPQRSLIVALRPLR